MAFGAATPQPDPQVMERWKNTSRTEKLDYRTKGTKNMICTWYQVNSCRNGPNCTYEHVCIRCHKPGHGAADGTCTAVPKMK